MTPLGSPPSRNAAFALLKAQCAALSDPVLSDEELGPLLDAALRWTVWQPLTAYAFGATVIPTVRNGHAYRAETVRTGGNPAQGLSAATEPIWPVDSLRSGRFSLTQPFWYEGPATDARPAQVTDGSLRWWDGGADGDQYDVRQAVYHAWLLKAARAAERYDSTHSNVKLIVSQVQAHCLTMADRFRPVLL